MARFAPTRMLVLALVTIAGTIISQASAEVISLRAALTSRSQVPSNDSPGTGQGTFSYNTDTKQLRFTITYDGLTGPATAAHIHGPAAADANAGVIVPFAVPESPISGTATLTEEQAAALLAGRTYVNVHTNTHRGGEIRGQILR